MGKSRTATCARGACLLVLCGLAGCSEETKFTPLDPTATANRITQTLDAQQFKLTDRIGAGRAAEITTFTVYEGEHPSIVVLLDWLSTSNNITLAVHRRGNGGVIDAGQTTFDNCSVPASSTNGGTVIGAALPQPLCPVVVSNTTNGKPKALEISDIGQGNYSIVATNPGSAETLRYAFLEN